MKTLLIAPLQDELRFFLQGCTRQGMHCHEAVIGRLPVLRLAALDVTLACGGLGKVQFAVQTQHLLDMCTDWDLVVCIGAAGALNDELCVGDVVVATTTMEHDFNNKFGPRRMPTFRATEAAIAGLRSTALDLSSFHVHFGPIASGDEDIVDVERRHALRELTGALAVAWEGAGGARACAFSGIPFVEIRGITDAANHTAAADFRTNLSIAMGNVADLVTAWLMC